MDVRFTFGNLNVVLFSFARDPINPSMYYIEHCHDSYELRYVEYGLGYISISGIDVTVSKNEIYIIGPRIMHRRRSDRNNPLLEYCIKFDIRMRTNSNLCTQEEQRLLDVLSNPYPYVFSATKELHTLFLYMIKALTEKSDIYILYVKASFMQLLMKLYQCIVSHRQLDESARIAPSELSSKNIRLQQIVEYIEINLNNRISIQDLSDLLGISSRQINRIMVAGFGVTFCDYVDAFRFNIAKDLLTSTGRSISDIAFMSGFSTPQQMYRLFLKKASCSPNQYRISSPEQKKNP